MNTKKEGIQMTFYCLFCEAPYTTEQELSACLDKHIDELSKQGHHHIKRKKKATINNETISVQSDNKKLIE